MVIEWIQALNDYDNAVAHLDHTKNKYIRLAKEALSSIASNAITGDQAKGPFWGLHEGQLNPFKNPDLRALVFSQEIDPRIRQAFEGLEKRFLEYQEPSRFGVSGDLAEEDGQFEPKAEGTEHSSDHTNKDN